MGGRTDDGAGVNPLEIMHRSSGTVSVGHGIPAFHIDVESIGEDYLVGIQDNGATVLIMLASIVFYRFDDE